MQTCLKTRLEVTACLLYTSGVSKIEIERASDRVKVIIYTAKPGVVIGKGGAEIEYDKVDKVRGMDIIFVTTANTDEEARELLTLFNKMCIRDRLFLVQT